MAASRLTSGELSRLRSLIRPELADDQAREQVELDWEFHHAIVRASGNDLLVALLDGLAAPTMRMRIWRGISVPGALERTVFEHRDFAGARRVFHLNILYVGDAWNDRISSAKVRCS